MSPGNPNFRASPYPPFVMYKTRAPPRSFEPANTELSKPGMRAVDPHPVAYAIGSGADAGGDDAEGDSGVPPMHSRELVVYKPQRSQGREPPRGRTHALPPPREHGVPEHVSGQRSGVQDRVPFLNSSSGYSDEYENDRKRKRGDPLAPKPTRGPNKKRIRLQEKSFEDLD